MKINKGISVLLASMLIGGMLVGCSNNSNSDTTKVLTKTVKEVTKDDTEVEATKDKEKNFHPQDNNKSSEKQVNTKKDNNKSTPKDTNQKEIKSTKEATQKNTTKDKSEKNNSTQKKTTSNTDTKEKETPKKEEQKQKGYWVTCQNGHKVWTVNGDYDCQQCYDDYMNQKDDEKNDTEKKDIYWCSECQCFSTYKHNHPVELPVDNYEEPIQEEDTY